jgi:hypothetical protein
MVYGPHDKVSYTIRHLTTGKEYLADVTHLRPFFYDPRFTTPLNVAARDTKEYVVKSILRHDFSDPDNKRWLVQWALDGDEDETWEPFEVLKDVEAFHTYCAANGMSTLFPKKHPAFAGLHVPKSGPTKRQAQPTTTSDLPVDGPNKRTSRNKGSTSTSGPIPLDTANQVMTSKKRRGRPTKPTTTSTSGATPEDA